MSDSSGNKDFKDFTKDDVNGGSKGSDRGSDRKDICRDFLNNICNRGSRCKFYHPPEAEKQCAADEPYNFCLDYQNKGCNRDNCRYVHAHRDDVDLYKNTGEVTLALARSLAALARTDEIAGTPVCKQFQTGHCERGQQCRYWHINMEEERRKRFAGRSCGGGPGSGRREDYQGGARSGWRRAASYHPGEMDDYYGAPPAKRAYGAGFGAFGQAAPAMRTPMPPPAIQSNPSQQALIDQLERRNTELLTEVEALRRENRRERERYEDLLSLFRQTCQGGKPASTTPAGLSSLSTPLGSSGGPSSSVGGGPSSYLDSGSRSMGGGPPGQMSHHEVGQQQQPLYSWSSAADQNPSKYQWGT